MKNIPLVIFILSFLMCSCTSTSQQTTTKIILDEPEIIEYTLSFENTQELNTLEPKEGIVLGAYFPYSIYYGIKEYENVTEKSMNHYVYEYILGTEFDTTFIIDCISKNKIPFIKVIPKSYDKYNLDHIESLSSLLEYLNINCYVELFPSPSDMQYSADNYKDYFEKSSTILKNKNENISIIFTPNSNELFSSYDFYPSHSSYDFLGFNYIGKILNNNNDNIYEDFFHKFNYVYKNNQYNKPIFITTFAVSHFSLLNNTYYIDENISYTNYIINTLKENYKKVKGINFYDIDSRINTFQGENNYNDNYKITENKKIKDNFQKLITDYAFLEKYEYSKIDKKDKYIYDALLVEDDYYVSTKIDSNVYFEEMKHNEIISSYTFHDKQYYKLNDLFNNTQKYNIKINDTNKTITLY